jgi:hypothetical protein
MPLMIDKAGADANSRLAAIRLAMLTLRCMENWRKHVADYDSAMILIAIVAICAERLTRAKKLDPAVRSLKNPISPRLLAPCNVSSIAAATGLNRETARRKVNELIEAGFVVRSADGSISFAPGIAQESRAKETIDVQLEAVTRMMNGLIRDGAVKIRAGTKD